MPNYCTNELTIRGNVKGFLEANKGRRADYSGEDDSSEQDFTFNALVPVPETVLQAGYNDEGYDWQINNWGTKWDVNEVQPIMDIDDSHYALSFDTAWSPPLEWLQKASEAYPGVMLDLIYHEMGMMFCGRLAVLDGTVLKEEQYSGDKDELWDFMEEEFDMCREDYFGEEEDEEDDII